MSSNLSKEISDLGREVSSMQSTLQANHEVHMANQRTIDKILEQTIKTNGRVNGHDTSLSGINVRLNTAIWAFGLTLPIILSMGIWIYFQRYEALQVKVETLQTLLDTYNK